MQEAAVVPTAIHQDGTFVRPSPRVARRRSVSAAIRLDAADVSLDRVYLAMMAEANLRDDQTSQATVAADELEPSALSPEPLVTSSAEDLFSAHAADVTIDPWPSKPAANLRNAAQKAWARCLHRISWSLAPSSASWPRPVPEWPDMAIEVPAQVFEVKGALAIGFASAALLGVAMFLVLLPKT